jgi:hypothetical protein
MESLDRLICDKRLKSIVSSSSNAVATTTHFANHRRAIVQASLSTVFDRKGRHLSGTFCLTGDTMEGIIQCLVFLKAFSVSFVFPLVTIYTYSSFVLFFQQSNCVVGSFSFQPKFITSAKYEKYNRDYSNMMI